MIHAIGQPEVPGALLARWFLPLARRYLLAFAQKGVGMTTATNALIMLGPTRWFAPFWPNLTPLHWPERWGQLGPTRDYRE